MNIFVTGACGYKGTVLVPKLLLAGHKVTAFDLMWFGNKLQAHDGGFTGESNSRVRIECTLMIPKAKLK